MKRSRNEDVGPTWADPNQLGIPKLREALTTFGIRLDAGECRTKLFQRYVKLARIESPESVECWTGLDLDAPLPGAERFVVPKLRIILALYSVGYPAQASRGHLVKLFNALAKERDPSGSVGDICTRSSQSDPKKKKKNSKPTPLNLLPQSKPSRDKIAPTHADSPSHVGKTRRTKAREDKFFQPYRSSERPARSSVCPSSQSSGRSLSQVSRSSDAYSLRRSPRLRAAQEQMEQSRASHRPAQSSNRCEDETDADEADNDADETDDGDDKTDDDADSQAPTHATRSATWEPSSPEAHHQSPIAASSEAGDSERTASQPPSAASDSRPAEDGHSEGAASESLSNEPPTPSVKDESDDDADSRAPPPLPPPLKPETLNEPASQPPSAASDSRPAEDGHSEGAASESLSNEPPTPSVKDESDDDADSRAPSHATRSATWEPSSPEAHHQSPIAASSERTASQPPSEACDSRSERTASQLPSEASDSRSERTASQPPSEASDSRSEQTASQPPSEASDSRPAEAASEGHHSKSSVNVSREAQSYKVRSGSLVDEDRASGQESGVSSGHHESDVSSAPTRRTRPAYRPAQKRKPEVPSEWPDALRLSRVEIEAYLDEYNVAYTSATRMARLIGSYNLLRSTVPNLGEQRASKRPKAPQSRPRSLSRPPRIRRKSRSRVEASAEPDECGFVYRRPKPPSIPRTESSPSEPSVSRENSPSSVSPSDYQPSVASTELSEAPSAAPTPRTSISARSTTSSREFPTKHTRQKRAKSNHAEAPTRKKRARPRAQQRQLKGRREWGRPSSTQQEDHLVNFVPVLPDHSQKRKNQQADLHVKRRRTGTDDPRPQATSRPSRINRVRQNSYAVRPAFLDSNQLDPHESDLEHQLPESPQSNRSSSALRRFSFRSQPVDEESDSQESNGLPSASRPLPSRSQPVDHEPDAPSTLVRPNKRKQPHHPSASTHREKRRATPVAPRIPTSAQVHRRRQRQARVRPGSLRVTPSFRDDDVIVPTYHPAASGVESWRSSLPRDLSCPPEPTTSSPSEPPTPPRRRQAGPVTGCCAGQQLVSQLTEATGLLTVCLERVGLSAQGPQISTTTRPSGTHRNLSLLARVRQHMKTLFGKCMELNQFPPPATEQEKANWKDYDQDNDSEDDSDDESVLSGSLHSGDDPAFPYRNGPGHREASAATLSIMWRCMRKAGVVSFRPDFTRRHRDPDNMFLWDLAHHIFIKLVRAQHYSEIDLESSTEASIRQAILNHTRHLRRTYHEAGWDARRLDSRAVLKRRQARTNRLRDNRVKFLGTQAALVPLISVATECTSDAETEANDGRQKRVAVKHLPWRHPRIGRAFKMTQDQHQIMSNIPSIRCLL
ncbi:uncharacterized protein PGTG_21414 [Puccinia graminis f. sp. tritici CRL 75-36-700-3]|uniref:Uncharacterized protein n=1 Tax=Puccinia graminis f. sp. tritici (strain CRL 75-36-700-3 / race SCCL) TaxID=418459 RepID=H6QR93_PUCGT|nr:uncharacterized protein PGTG_21414 [Puccinia graminis f. sp. tritici CRL 75-36-700-3]EHS63084.1 hypothetical protein PGTG_21414 [Puccinia graminis f. sp. tritici CRL 75-36-700-3]